jgi:hypothetical protein
LNPDEIVIIGKNAAVKGGFTLEEEGARIIGNICYKW